MSGDKLSETLAQEEREYLARQRDEQRLEALLEREAAEGPLCGLESDGLWHDVQ